MFGHKITWFFCDHVSHCLGQISSDLIHSLLTSSFPVGHRPGLDRNNFNNHHPSLPEQSIRTFPVRFPPHHSTESWEVSPLRGPSRTQQNPCSPAVQRHAHTPNPFFQFHPWASFKKMLNYFYCCSLFHCSSCFLSSVNREPAEAPPTEWHGETTSPLPPPAPLVNKDSRLRSNSSSSSKLTETFTLFFSSILCLDDDCFTAFSFLFEFRCSF